jgi:endonuclease/exonuclease/phosphatase (EEP) superfamily protein YafD
MTPLPKASTMHTLVSAFCNAVLIGVFLVAFGAAFGRLHPTIDIVGQFVLAAMIGAVVIALLALLTARYTTALVAVAALLTNLLIAWPWIQSPAHTDAAGPKLKVLLFNVYYNNTHLDQVADLARRTNADIVVLLEVIPRVRPGLDNVVADYPHRVECWQERDCDALILSRFPLEDIRASLPEPKHRRPTAAARVAVGDRSLALFAAHLSLPPLLHPRNSQLDEMQSISEAVNGLSGPRLLVGDFNAATWGAVISNARNFAALHVLTGPSGTWPSFLPRDMSIPIDHMLASQDVVFLSREVITMPGSDHRAVLAEIAFKN